MRTYGRTTEGVWVEIDDPNYIQLATLAQTLRLTEGESPFYANYGIPSHDSVMSQIAPDAAVARTQSQYGQYFANLNINKESGILTPTYNITAVFLNGTIIQSTVAT